MPRRDADELLEEALAALEDGEYEDAIELAEKVLMQRPGDAEASWVLGNSLLDLGDAIAALPHLQRTAAALPDDPEAWADYGGALFETLQFTEARSALQKAVALDARVARAHHWIALIEEREGNDRLAKRHFDQARKLDPESYPNPHRVTEAEFQSMVEEAIRDLPADFRASLKNLDIVVEPFPDDDTLTGDPPFSPTILGLHVGHAVDERPPSGPAGQLPNVIFLFQRNIERSATDEETLVDEIRVTLLHEIGHYLGLDEDEVEERGLE